MNCHLPSEPSIVGVDLDGTLIDTWRRHELLIDSVLTRFGIEDKLVDFVQAKREGRSTEQVLRDSGFSPAASRAMAQAWKEEVESDEWLDEDQVFKDSIPFLKMFGVDFILCSARTNADRLHRQLKKLGIEPLLTDIACVNPGHTAVENKALAWRRANVEVVIGDSEVDSLAARSIGVPVYLLHRGSRSKNYLKTLGWNSHEVLPREL